VSQGLSRRIFLYLLAVLVTAAFAVMAITVMASTGEAQYKHPNSGSGNISEECPPDQPDCDPGNSGGHNQGGD